MASDDFINWEDLDLDSVLGEDNWTDTEQTKILGSENEWMSSDSDHDEMLLPANSRTTKECTTKPKAHDDEPKRTCKHYQCPLCDKQYTSTSGFRGHVMKKHKRPDIRG